MESRGLLPRRRFETNGALPTELGPSLVTLRVEAEHAPFVHHEPAHTGLRRAAPHRNTLLAAQIFALTARHPATLAACLLPDRLLWLLRPGWDVAETVGRFKAYSNRLASQAGIDRRLWTHAYERTPIAGPGTDVGRLLVEEPQRCGLVSSSAEYPWKIRRI